MLLNFYVFAIFFATIVLLSVKKKKTKMERYYKQPHHEHKR